MVELPIRKQRLVFAILEMLTDDMQSGAIKQDDKEGIEVASASSSLWNKV
jgi:hypothetical protein